MDPQTPVIWILSSSNGILIVILECCAIRWILSMFIKGDVELEHIKIMVSLVQRYSVIWIQSEYRDVGLVAVVLTNFNFSYFTYFLL